MRHPVGLSSPRRARSLRSSAEAVSVGPALSSPHHEATLLNHGVAGAHCRNRCSRRRRTAVLRRTAPKVGSRAADQLRAEIRSTSASRGSQRIVAKNGSLISARCTGGDPARRRSFPRRQDAVRSPSPAVGEAGDRRRCRHECLDLKSARKYRRCVSMALLDPDRRPRGPVIHLVAERLRAGEAAMSPFVSDQRGVLLGTTVFIAGQYFGKHCGSLVLLHSPSLVDQRRTLRGFLDDRWFFVPRTMHRVDFRGVTLTKIRAIA